MASTLSKIMIFEIITIDDINYYLLDKLKLIVNNKNEIIGIYDYYYSTLSKTEEENTKYIIENKIKFFF